MASSSQRLHEALVCSAGGQVGGLRVSSLEKILPTTRCVRSAPVVRTLQGLVRIGYTRWSQGDTGDRDVAMVQCSLAG